MMPIVVDTNVTVAWYLPEEFRAAARLWQDRLLRGTVQLLTPSFHYWEFANVLRTYVRRGELDAEVAAEIYQLHLDAPLEVAEPDRERVLATAQSYEATAYDAVYIALALQLDVGLLTAERTTTPWVVKLGDRIESVRS